MVKRTLGALSGRAPSVRYHVLTWYLSVALSPVCCTSYSTPEAALSAHTASHDEITSTPSMYASTKKIHSNLPYASASLRSPRALCLWVSRDDRR